MNNYGQPDMTNGFVTGGSSPAIAAFKKTARSPLFLLAVALLAISIIFSLVGSFTSEVPDSISSTVREFIGKNSETLKMDSSDLRELDEILNHVGPIYKWTSVSGNVPSILLFVALLLVVVSAGTRSDRPLSTAGLTILKVFAIIELVLSIIMTVALTAVLGVSAFMMIKEGDEIKGVGIIFAVLTVVVLIVCIFCVIFFAKKLKTISTAKKTVVTGIASDKVSGFVGVVAFILGALSVIGSISLMINTSATAGLASLLSGAANILFALTLFSYRTAMREVMENRSAG